MRMTHRLLLLSALGAGLAAAPAVTAQAAAPTRSVAVGVAQGAGRTSLYQPRNRRYWRGYRDGYRRGVRDGRNDCTRSGYFYGGRGGSYSRGWADGYDEGYSRYCG